MVELGPTEVRAGGYSNYGELKGLPFDTSKWWYISSPYGPRNIFTLPDGRVSGSFHTGIDIPAPVGTPVMAPAPGVVVGQRVSSRYGNMVTLKHKDNSATVYLHLREDTLMVGKGMELRRGDILGFVGTTGFSTGNHLHWEYHPVYGRTGVDDPLNHIVAVLTEEPVVEEVSNKALTRFVAETKMLIATVAHLRAYPRDYDVAMGAIERELQEMLQATK